MRKGVFFLALALIIIVLAGFMIPSGGEGFFLRQLNSNKESISSLLKISLSDSKVQLAPPVFCGSTAPLCNGPCPPGQSCTVAGPNNCICQYVENTCGGSAPLCNGPCPPNYICSTVAGTTPACACVPQTPPPQPPNPPSPTCGSQPYPVCSNGPCPSGQTCQAQSGGCQCVSGVPPGGEIIPPSNPDNPNPPVTTPSLKPDCSNLPHGYDMLTFKIGKDYVREKVTLSDYNYNTKIITIPLRYITVKSCNPNAFNNPNPDLVLPSGIVDSKWITLADDASTAYLITGIKVPDGMRVSGGFLWDENSDFSTVIYGLAVREPNGALPEYHIFNYFYWKNLFSNPYSKYYGIYYDPFNYYNSVEWNEDPSYYGYILTGLSFPLILFDFGGTMPFDPDKKSVFQLSDVPRKYGRISDVLSQGFITATEEIPSDPAWMSIINSLLKTFDAYSRHTGVELLNGFDKIAIHYDNNKNEFAAPKGFTSPVEIISLKSESLPTVKNRFSKIKSKSYSYPIPFILTSGTNVIQATSDEIIILYSQKHQNRPSVTFGTIYDNKKPVPSTYSCIDACLSKASDMPTICPEISECKMNCPVDSKVQKEMNSCSKKLKNYYGCLKDASRAFDKKKKPSISKEEYLLTCGAVEPCKMPGFVPDSKCAARCVEEDSLCKTYEPLIRRIGCTVACTSINNACSDIAFQVKLPAKKWKKVTIPDKVPEVISYKDFYDCQGLQIRTINGKKVGVSANFLQSGEVYAFRVNKACTAKYLPGACRSPTISSKPKFAKVDNDELEESE